MWPSCGDSASARSVESLISSGYDAFLITRREEILARVEAACNRCGRSSAEVTLAAVSKTVNPEEALLAYRAGYSVFAENRPQELVRKIEALHQMTSDEIRFDMIGNLQTNKVNHVIGNARLIHSVSSEKLARVISSHCEARELQQDVLLEVNISGEESKSGFDPQVLQEAFGEIVELPALKVRGLMCMAPAHDAYRAQKTFEDFRNFRDKLTDEYHYPLPELSCGMSDDFEAAIQEGSTFIRLGRIVFSPEYQLM